MVNIRIPYQYEGKQKIYIVDFINYQTKQCIEVKPEEHKNNPKVIAKMTALNQWCKENGYALKLADQHYFVKFPIESIDFSQFDDVSQKKIKEMYARYKSKRDRKA